MGIFDKFKRVPVIKAIQEDKKPLEKALQPKENPIELNNERIAEIYIENYDIVGRVMDIDLDYLSRLEKLLEKPLAEKLENPISILKEILSGNSQNSGDLILVKEKLIELCEDLKSDKNLDKKIEIEKELGKSPIDVLKKFIYYNLNKVESLVTILDGDVIKKGAEFLDSSIEEFEKSVGENPNIVVEKILGKMEKSGADFKDLIDGSKKNKKRVRLVMCALLSLAGCGNKQEKSIHDESNVENFNIDSAENIENILSSGTEEIFTEANRILDIIKDKHSKGIDIMDHKQELTTLKESVKKAMGNKNISLSEVKEMGNLLEKIEEELNIIKESREN